MYGICTGTLLPLAINVAKVLPKITCGNNTKLCVRDPIVKMTLPVVVFAMFAESFSP